jgi:hypothetical protein
MINKTHRFVELVCFWFYMKQTGRILITLVIVYVAYLGAGLNDSDDNVADYGQGSVVDSADSSSKTSVQTLTRNTESSKLASQVSTYPEPIDKTQSTKSTSSCNGQCLTSLLDKLGQGVQLSQDDYRLLIKDINQEYHALTELRGS